MEPLNIEGPEARVGKSEWALTDEYFIVVGMLVRKRTTYILLGVAGAVAVVILLSVCLGRVLSGSATRIPGVKKMYTFQRAPNHIIVDICMREKGLNSEYFDKTEVWVNLDNEDNRNPTNLAMNRQGSIPWFVMDDGTVLAETIAMCEYIEEVLPKPPIIGTNALQRGKVRAWQRRMEEHYVYPAFYGHRFWTASEDCPSAFFMKDFFKDRLNKQNGANLIPSAWKDLITWAVNRIEWLESAKQEEARANGKASQYIAGDFFSVVDIQVYVVIRFFETEFPYPPQPILKSLQGKAPWVEEWYKRCDSRPSSIAAWEDRQKDLRNHKTVPKKCSKEECTFKL